MIHLKGHDTDIPMCGRADWDRLTQDPEQNQCGECASIAGLDHPFKRTGTVKHSAEAPVQRFYSETDTLHAEPGCYVDGSMSIRACTWKALTVARGFGAVTTDQFAQYVYELEHTAPHDGSETYLALGDQILDHLNEGNLSDTYFWFWDEGSLMYGEIS